MCGGGLLLEVEAAVLLKLGLSPSRVEEVVNELLYHGCVYLRMVETKRAEGHWHADIQCPISPLKVGKMTWRTPLGSHIGSLFLHGRPCEKSDGATQINRLAISCVISFNSC